MSVASHNQPAVRVLELETLSFTTAYCLSLHTITLRKDKDAQAFYLLHSRERFKTYKNVICDSVSLTLGPEKQM